MKISGQKVSWGESDDTATSCKVSSWGWLSCRSQCWIDRYRRGLVAISVSRRCWKAWYRAGSSAQGRYQKSWKTKPLLHSYASSSIGTAWPHRHCHNPLPDTKLLAAEQGIENNHFSRPASICDPWKRGSLQAATQSKIRPSLLFFHIYRFTRETQWSPYLSREKYPEPRLNNHRYFSRHSVSSMQNAQARLFILLIAY